MQDFTKEITEKIQGALIEEYKKTPEFDLQVKDLMLTQGFTYESMNKYLNDCVDIGIPVSQALNCYVLSLQLKK